jgi:Domain of unknown function (DUF4082)
MKLRLKTVLLACVCLPAAWGDSFALSLTPNPTLVFNNGSGYSLGFQFTLSQAITVDALGFFADPGLADSHAVGIFNTGGSLLVSTTVTGADPLTSDFRYQSISPFALAAGTYIISGVTGVTDPYTFNPTAFSTAPGVTFDNSEFIQSSSLTFPTGTDSNTAFFGPNFEFIGSVPEPSSWIFLFTVAGFIWTLGRRTFRQSQR